MAFRNGLPHSVEPAEHASQFLYKSNQINVNSDQELIQKTHLYIYILYNRINDRSDQERVQNQTKKNGWQTMDGIAYRCGKKHACSPTQIVKVYGES